MAAVTTSVPWWKADREKQVAARPAYRANGKYRMKIVNENGDNILVPFAPLNINHGERGVEWSEIDRFGTYATFRRTGLKVPTLSFDLVIAARGTHGRNNIIGYLSALDRLSELESRVYIKYSVREVGAWIMTSYSVNVTHRDVYHRPIRADVSLSFARIMDEKAFLGPIKGRSSTLKVTPKPSKPKKTTTTGNLATYKVKKGDTLWDLARKYYGNPYLWPKIADRNGVKNPRLLQIGTRLVIPKV